LLPEVLGQPLEIDVVVSRDDAVFHGDLLRAVAGLGAPPRGKRNRSTGAGRMVQRSLQRAGPKVAFRRLQGLAPVSRNSGTRVLPSPHPHLLRSARRSMDRPMAKRSDATTVLAPGSVTLPQLRRLHDERVHVQMDEAALRDVQAARDAVIRALQRGKTAYGINTGFGKFAQTVIAPDRLAELQTNLVLSHRAGTGELLADQTVRLVMILKAISLARGYSGVRPEVVQALLHLVNTRVYPCIPGKGSVGASGDLAPLAHLAAALIGTGEVRVDG